MNHLEQHKKLSSEEEKIWNILETVCDPEIPVLAITDLGIVRRVELYPLPTGEGWGGTVTITPTYSGCPAMDAISIDIKLKLIEHGYKNIKITSVLSPAWTTEWMTEEGKRKLKEYGIAPPLTRSDRLVLTGTVETIQCPQCSSSNTKLLSQFGSTACKALYKCNDCLEPFDYFKCH